MTAFEKGYLAAEVGMPVSACPYPPQSGEAVSWCNGHRALERIRVARAPAEARS
jgi:ribosome modulation factor